VAGEYMSDFQITDAIESMRSEAHKLLALNKIIARWLGMILRSNYLSLYYNILFAAAA
jgi:hypothetical protein